MDLGFYINSQKKDSLFLAKGMDKDHDFQFEIRHKDKYYLFKGQDAEVVR